MGSYWARFCEGPPEWEIREINKLKASLLNLALTLNPENLLQMALENGEIYELCKENSSLRELYMKGAVKRYHLERHFYEDVYNRSADYMVLLDNLVEIQADEEEKIRKKELKKQRRAAFFRPIRKFFRIDNTRNATQEEESFELK